MSEFDDFIREAFSESLAIIGTTPFAIDGLAGNFAGDYDQLQVGYDVEVGGRVVTVTSRLMCAPAQFSITPRAGLFVHIFDRKLMIGLVTFDSASITLDLTGPDK